MQTPGVSISTEVHPLPQGPAKGKQKKCTEHCNSVQNKVAGDARLERATFGSGGQRSIHLS